jgi:hypothetical protein
MHIAIALGTLGEPSVIPQLLRWLSDPQISLSVGLNIATTSGTWHSFSNYGTVDCRCEVSERDGFFNGRKYVNF